MKVLNNSITQYNMIKLTDLYFKLKLRTGTKLLLNGFTFSHNNTISISILDWLIMKLVTGHNINNPVINELLLVKNFLIENNIDLIVNTH